jgi:uncharacterized coiled-coil DUF342 family protein
MNICDECGVDTVALLAERDQLKVEVERWKESVAHAQREEGKQYAEVCRLKAELDFMRTWASKTHDEMRHQSQLRQQWHDTSRELAKELDWRYGRYSWKDTKNSTGLALARFEKMEKGNEACHGN